jgi:hypothetical protein
MGDLIGFAALVVVIGALSGLLHPFVRRSRVRRAALWAVVWGLGGWLWASVSVAIDGTHQVHWSRWTREWVDVDWTRAGAAEFGLAIGVLGAVTAFWLPWSADGPSNRGRRRTMAARRARRRSGS